MGLELLGIALGLTTFASQLKHRKLVIHCDNTGAEVAFSLPVVARACSRVVQVAVRKGTARAHDHAQLCHEQWLRLANLRAHAWVVRVDTDYNVADLPSREACYIASFAADRFAVSEGTSPVESLGTSSLGCRLGPRFLASEYCRTGGPPSGGQTKLSERCAFH